MSAMVLIPLFVFILTFILRIPIALGMVAAGIYYFMASGLDIGIVVDNVAYNLYSSYVLIAIPLFVFTANVMNSGLITDRVFSFANSIVGRYKGGMGHVNVAASLIFSGMTGSAVADASGLGKMEIEAMRKQGYDRGFSSAITAASATIGPIFPPSIPLVIYAMLSGASVGALFLGGIIPGILLAIALMIYVAFLARKRNYPTGDRYKFKDFLRVTLRAFPALLTPVILLVGIYAGVMTPTEAGAVSAFYALIISFFVYRTLGRKGLFKLFVDTVSTTGSLCLIVGASFVFSYIIASEQIPGMIATYMLDITENKIVLLLVINLLFLLLGMVMDTSTIMVVFIPIVLPLVESLGIDLVHFGVMIVLNMMIGLSTPPFGMLLFIVSKVGETPLMEVIKEIAPMLVVMIIVLLLVTLIPEITLFIPNSIK
ncbi:TRAP transporter large permease [Bacillus sp. S/N-304-OC-R1]|uniref:TRAP transporter large permease n=1 Tax=Bacillus sp. S/N-304-OC-R1 TaxID=2758034 RepID=UPI001C8EBE73|nr:TRAP transporter large permease [Bacillus sp. S/N-304-OC-R1]MBY0121459.1 TRAP transporter large permease [Bacillus sp. S/N-304-OC-R1]